MSGIFSHNESETFVDPRLLMSDKRDFVGRPSFYKMITFMDLDNCFCFCCLVWCKNEALKKLHLKSTIKCFKEVKIDK